MGTDTGSMTGTFLLFFGIIVVLFLICREIVCWYWKINAHLQIAEENRQVLKEIKAILQSMDEKSQQLPEQIGDAFQQVGEKLIRHPNRQTSEGKAEKTEADERSERDSLMRRQIRSVQEGKSESPE